jgi:membrane protein DedA with SNARE-associated domain
VTFPLWLQQAIETFGYLAIFALVTLETTGIPLPGETALVLAAVYAGTTGRLNIVGVIAAAAIGAILGDNIGYTIGRRGGYPLLRRIARLLHIDERKLVYTERYFEQHGDKTVLIGRFFAILRVWVAFLAGASRMPRRTFFVWNATGGILWATIFGTLGFVLGDNLPLLERILKTAGIGGTSLLILALLSIPLIWRWRHRTERQRLAMIRSADALSHQAAPDAPTQETAPNAATPLDRRR